MQDKPMEINLARPTPSEIIQLWNTIQIQRLDNWTSAANALKEKISEVYCNGGIQLHKYKIKANKDLDWFAQRNCLDEIDFLNSILSHKDLEEYRQDIQTFDKKPEASNVKYYPDLHELFQALTEIMEQGGAYQKTNYETARRLALDFVKLELEMRITEFNCFFYNIASAHWYHHIAWDYSFLIFDKRKYEIIFIDMTDTD